MDDHKPTYESQPRRSITQWIKSQPLFDWLVAAYQNTRWSARQIEPFIRKYQIDMSEFEPVKYRSFAEFFDRRFRPGVRQFPSAADQMGAFAEARYFAWIDCKPISAFRSKGTRYVPSRFSAMPNARDRSSAAPYSSHGWLRSTTTTCTIVTMGPHWITSAWEAACGR